MGKWKYINWLVVVVVLVFMYNHFSVRYEASLNVYVLSTIGWLTMGGLAHYIFVFSINKTDKNTKNLVTTPEITKTAARERPKVVLKKTHNNQNDKK